MNSDSTAASGRTSGLPHWLQEIDATLPVTAQYVVSGNVHDRHLVTDGEGPPRLLGAIESPLAVGMRILICSDGLTDYVGKDRVATVLASSQTSIDAVARLIGLTLDVGAPDNVTVALLDVED